MAGTGGDKWLQAFVPYLLYRITSQLNRRLRDRLRREGINISRWRVLAVLQAHGALALGNVVELTSMEQPSVSRIVSQLADEGLVRREASREDSRVVIVTLTTAGRKAFASIYPTAESHQARALRGFSKREIDALKSYLQRIRANIETDD